MALLQEIKVPLLAVNDTSLTVVELNCENGQQVKKGDRIMVLETSKTTYDVEAESEGYIQYLCEIGHDYEVNEVVANIFSDSAETEKTSNPVLKPVEENTRSLTIDHPPVEDWEGDTLFSHDAIRLIEVNNINRAAFQGRDFVNRQDVEELLGGKKSKLSGPLQPENAKSARLKPILPVDLEKMTVEKISSNKRREIEYLSEVQSTGLTSTVNIIVETEGIFTHINPSLKYLKDSLLPVIIYETARLLKKYPPLNAYFTGEAIAYYKEVNIGFAIDIEKGLKVLKVASTADKTVHAIEEEIMQLSGNYLDDKLQIGDLVDITFTITDLSAEGVAFFRPLVNMMNSAILGISAIDQKLQRCILSITFDHRITEGKLAAQFLQDLKERLESYQSKYHVHPNQEIACSKCYKKLSEDIGNVGFVKCITPAGMEGYICQSCLKGF